MPTITAIKPQKSKKRVNVYLDGKFGFGLDLQTFIKEGLKVEQELSEKNITDIVKLGQFQDAYDKILRFASIRPRSKKEYRDWLKKHEIHSSLNGEIFNRLKRLDLLDDRKFAAWWVDQRMRFKPKSKRILTQELRIKGVEPGIISATIADQKVDERASVKEILLKKNRLWRGLSGFEKRKKIFNYLIQRGFDVEIIRDLLGENEEI